MSLQIRVVTLTSVARVSTRCLGRAPDGGGGAGQLGISRLSAEGRGGLLDLLLLELLLLGSFGLAPLF